jgi:hypothetical protein
MTFIAQSHLDIAVKKQMKFSIGWFFEITLVHLKCIFVLGAILDIGHHFGGIIIKSFCDIIKGE